MDPPTQRLPLQASARDASGAQPSRAEPGPNGLKGFNSDGDVPKFILVGLLDLGLIRSCFLPTKCLVVGNHA